MTRFVTYDREVAARLAQAVGVHRVELRDARPYPAAVNPALYDAVRARFSRAILLPASDEQVLLVRVMDSLSADQVRPPKKRKNSQSEKAERELHEIGTQPTGFLGLQDEPVFEEDDEDPPRSLWKKEQ